VGEKLLTQTLQCCSVAAAIAPAPGLRENQNKTQFSRHQQPFFGMVSGVLDLAKKYE